MGNCIFNQKSTVETSNKIPGKNYTEKKITKGKKDSILRDIIENRREEIPPSKLLQCEDPPQDAAGDSRNYVSNCQKEKNADNFSNLSKIIKGSPFSIGMNKPICVEVTAQLNEKMEPKLLECICPRQYSKSSYSNDISQSGNCNPGLKTEQIMTKAITQKPPINPSYNNSFRKSMLCSNQDIINDQNKSNSITCRRNIRMKKHVKRKGIEVSNKDELLFPNSDNKSIQYDKSGVSKNASSESLNRISSQDSLNVTRTAVQKRRRVIPSCSRLEYTFYINDEDDMRKPFHDKRVATIAKVHQCNVTLIDIKNGQKPIYHKGIRVCPVIISTNKMTNLKRCIARMDRQFPQFNVKTFFPN